MIMLTLNVFGGLAIFIYGMKLMSDGLNKAAGERMRNILRFFAANRFVAILSGTLVTAVIQSSSASTVMVIGFVNAGLLNLVQAIGIIFGANIGTTVTAQLVAFDVGWLIMPAIIAGLLMGFMPKPLWQGWGMTVIGFGFLFLGMTFMSDQLKTLSDNESFLSIFSTFDCAPLDGSIPFGTLIGAICVGLIATMVVQSSSACTGIIIALGASGIINLYTAVALTLGSNIGTTITAQLAAIPANRIAKQAALAHTLFNVAGVCIISSTFWITFGESTTPIFFRAVEALSGGSDYLPRQIANAHTLFNLCTTLILVPFIPLLAKVCTKLIPTPTSNKIEYQYLEPHLLSTPSLALVQAKSTLEMMIDKAWEMTDAAVKKHLFTTGFDASGALKLKEEEEAVDRFQMEITNYLARLTCFSLLPSQAAAIPIIIHCVNDAERIGDHTLAFVELAKRRNAVQGELSEMAQNELYTLFDLLEKEYHTTMMALRDADEKASAIAIKMDEDLYELSNQYEQNHITRLAQNECSPLIGIIYVEILSEFRDVSRHMVNIAERATSLRRINSNQDVKELA